MKQIGKWAAWLGASLLFSQAALAWPEERPPQNTYTCKEVKVPMRDGTQLAADLYLPETPGPFAVVIERTPYSKNNCNFSQAPYLAQRGYAVLIQDVRGRNRSPGVFYQYIDEGWGPRQDGYDTIEWAGKQPWSSGEVGTIGVSYSCFNQNMTAPTQPPHLKAMFCSDSAANWFDHKYRGGALGGQGMDWLTDNNEAATPILMNRPGTVEGMERVQDWLDWNTRRIEHKLGFWESWMSPNLNNDLTHSAYDDYWRQLAPVEHAEKFTVPIFYTSGWYDRYPHEITRMFNAVRQRSASPAAREAVRLLIGPWLHGGARARARKVGDEDFGPEAAINYQALEVRWFDYHLKGIDNGIMKEGPVRLFVMGANQWRQEQAFPLARAVPTKFYARSAKSGTVESLNDGTLSRQMPPSGERADSFDYDPKTPLPSLGGDLFIQPNGVRDHRPVDQKSLTFTSDAFDADVEITGTSTVELYGSSTANDTDFVVTLTDVRPDGYSAILRQDIVRASRHDSMEHPAAIQPGKVYRFTLSVPPFSLLFRQRHRLRLTVSSSSFPRWLPNHNQFKLINEEAPYVAARNTIYHDAQRPSSVTVPIIPPNKPAPAGPLAAPGPQGD